MPILRDAAIRLAFAVFIGAAATGASAATPLPKYPTKGKENPVNYSFTADHAGNITAWFTGSTAGYTENLGLMINGVATGITGLGNKSSAYGDKLVLGQAKAGDRLVFFTNVANTGKTYFSDTRLNSDGVNHIFSAAFAGDAMVPAGTYVAFEDLWKGGDFNYFDETFVFDNVTTSSVGGVPEPASWTMLIAGFGLIGTAARRRGTTTIS